MFSDQSETNVFSYQSIRKIVAKYRAKINGERHMPLLVQNHLEKYHLFSVLRPKIRGKRRQLSNMPLLVQNHLENYHLFSVLHFKIRGKRRQFSKTRINSKTN